MYRFIKRIGNGAFGDVYLGIDLENDEEVAIKVEPLKTSDPQLRNEANIYLEMDGEIGFPSLKWIGVGSHYNAMVTDLLGKSLDYYFNLTGKFSLKTVLMLADQMLIRLEQLHSKGFVHRDIKPGNFLVGRGKRSHVIHLVDFGLSYRYLRRRRRSNQSSEDQSFPESNLDQLMNKKGDYYVRGNNRRMDNLNYERLAEEEFNHIPYAEGEPLIGTACFSSITTHLGVRQSRRDDLESLGYLLISFLTGSLPWLGIRSRSRTLKNSIMAEKKICTPLSLLCSGLPIEFIKYLDYVRSLRFKEQPDYLYLRRLFTDLFFRMGFTYDYIFDWS